LTRDAAYWFRLVPERHRAGANTMVR
jgi:hypothetical protein